MSPAPFILAVDPLSDVPSNLLSTFWWYMYVTGIPDGVALSAPNESVSRASFLISHRHQNFRKDDQKFSFMFFQERACWPLFL